MNDGKGAMKLEKGRIDHSGLSFPANIQNMTNSFMLLQGMDDLLSANSVFFKLQV